MDEKTAKRREILRHCTRFVSGHGFRTGRQWLEQILTMPEADELPEAYGEGAVIAGLEKQVAALLGKEAAVFMVKGVIAQLSAMRVWTERNNLPTIALPSQSHIDLDEDNAYQRLHNFRGVRLGNHNPFTLKDLEGVKERIGLVILELPLRRAGFKLPTWEELSAISEWCKARNVPLHFDGARLWESAPFYGRSLAEIAALADSVYVSFYKGLGGMAGCILAGEKDFIAEAKLWQSRHGGKVFTLFPQVLSAKYGLENFLPEMPQFHARAVELAEVLAKVPGVSIVPNPPHTNAFQVYVPGEPKKLEEAHLKMAAENKTWLAGWYSETALPDLTMLEISVGKATAAFSNAEIVELIKQLIERGMRNEG
jgi:threonine aldolase